MRVRTSTLLSLLRTLTAAILLKWTMLRYFRVCVCACVLVYVCMYVCMYVYIFVYVHMHVLVHVHVRDCVFVFVWIGGWEEEGRPKAR